jgi:peptidoglycan/xylan/chitin deacetylase (PgdA/CDA1 family)
LIFPSFPFAVLLALAPVAPAAAHGRAVAITFDDLPDLSGDEHTVEQTTAMMQKLISAIAAQRLPAIGFVNEDKLLDETNRRNDPRLELLLDAWLASGLDLGNHTFAHVDLHEVGPAKFEDDILRGEVTTRALCEKYHRPLKWFRHPYLDTGQTLADRDAVNAFLATHGYDVAPVTIDNSEWIYALAYEKAPSALVRWRVRNDYLRYMATRFAWYETRSHALFGREIRQVLLLHASTLNADVFPRLARMIRRRGYRFISLDEALADPAYRSPDTWIDGGVSWIERWGVTRGVSQKVFDRDPAASGWVVRLAGAREE